MREILQLEADSYNNEQSRQIESAMEEQEREWKEGVRGRFLPPATSPSSQLQLFDIRRLPDSLTAR